MPVTFPEASTVAIVVLLLLQIPPLMVGASVVVAPGHTVVVPVITPAVGAGLTVTVAVVNAVPQLVITV